METSTHSRYLVGCLLAIFLTLPIVYSQSECDPGYHVEGQVCSPDVRLVDEVRPQYGRLQFWHNGAWGEVCGEPSPAIAEVVCRHLGFLHAVGNLSQFDGYSNVFVADSTDEYSEPDIISHDIMCTGEETILNDCSITTYSPPRQSSDGCELNNTFIDMECNVLRARDVSNVPQFRFVDVFNYGWSPTCGDVNIWGQTETDLFGHWFGRDCQLGQALSYNGGSFPYVSVFHCSGTPSHLFDCYLEDTNCSSTTHAAVVCSSEIQLTAFGSVSLLYRAQPYEVTVCNSTVQDYLSRSTSAVIPIAYVACRQAGYPSLRDVSFQELITPRLAGFYEIVDCSSIFNSFYECTVDSTDCPGPINSQTYNKTSYALHVQCSDRVRESSLFGTHLRLYYDGSLYSPNGNLWDAAETDLVCRQLGRPVVKGHRIDHSGEDPVFGQNQLEYPFDVTCNSSHTKYHDCHVDYSQVHPDSAAPVNIFCDFLRLVPIPGYEGGRTEGYGTWPGFQLMDWFPLCVGRFSSYPVCFYLGYASQVQHPGSNFDFIAFCEGASPLFFNDCSRLFVNTSCGSNETLHVSCSVCVCDLYENNGLCLPCPSGLRPVQIGATSVNQCYNITIPQRDCFFETFTECLNNSVVYHLAQMVEFKELSCLQAYIHEGCSFNDCGVLDHSTIVEDLQTGWADSYCITYGYPGFTDVKPCRIQADFPALSACLDMRSTNNLGQLFEECRNIHAGEVPDEGSVCGVLNNVTDCYLTATFTACSAEAAHQASTYLYSNSTIGNCTQPVICEPLSCANGGICIPLNGEPVCICNARYTGPTCDTDLCVCQNGGTCDQQDSLICVCPTEYTGDQCETGLCELLNCDSGGTCNILNGESVCTCTARYTGATCDTDLCACQNGGTCDEQDSLTCMCPPEYTGDQCETGLCELLSCDNGGTCNVVSGVSVCTCSARYTGATCDADLCACQNGGTCDEQDLLTCTCPPEYTGDQCETGLCELLNCDNGGTCNVVSGVSVCICTTRYTGATCDIDVCPCQNGGICDQEDSLTCTCPSGFTGDQCQTDINECENGAPCIADTEECRNEVGGYACDCKPLLSRDLDGFCKAVLSINIRFTVLLDYGQHASTVITTVLNQLPPKLPFLKSEPTVTASEGSTKVVVGTSAVMTDVDNVMMILQEDISVSEIFGLPVDNSSLLIDVDECLSDQHNCSSDAMCNNTAQAFMCYCNTGYSGDGVNCVDIDECIPDDACHQQATCTNTDGSYECSCNTGFSGDGFSCTEGCLKGEQGVGAVDCEQCPRGYYKPNTGRQQCTACAPSMTTRTTGTIHREECIRECEAGFYTAFASSHPQGYCASCPINTFSETPGQISCTPCQPLRFTLKEGSQSRNDCKNICETQTDYCQNGGTCRFNSVNNEPSCECSLGFDGKICEVEVTVITSVLPLFGPRAGGTLIVIGGLHFNNTGQPRVQFDDIICPLVNSSDTQIVCLSMSVDSSYIDQELEVCVIWESENMTVCYSYFYIYLPDPTVDGIFPTESLLIGGTNVTVNGTNLMSVARPTLLITIVYRPISYSGSFTAGCEHVSNDQIICDTPEIVVPDDVRLAIIDHTNDQAARRRRRQTNDLEILAFINLDAVMDEDAQDIPFTVIADPEVIKPTETLVFQPFWPFNDEKFDIKASGFTTDAALNGTLVVLIGSGQCESIHRFENVIECTMSNRRPPNGENDEAGKLAIQVLLGRRLRFDAGNMDFQSNIFHYPPGRNGLIIGMVLLVVLIVAIVLFVRFRQKFIHRSTRDHQYSRHSEGHNTPPLRFGFGNSFISRPRYHPDSLSSSHSNQRPADRLLRGRL